MTSVIATFSNGGILTMGIIRVIKSEIRKSSEEIKRRENRLHMKCDFDDGVTYEQFQELAEKAVDDIKGRRIEISIHGPIIEGLVWSNTNLSTWRFNVDFNDYGHITGNYWVWSENNQSAIPRVIGKTVSLGIDRIFHETL